MNRLFANELSKWLPRLSGSAFKCLFVIYLELAVSNAPAVAITRQRFMDVTRLSQSAVRAALAEIVALRAALRQPRKGGGFVYSIPGLIFAPVENKPERKSTGVENKPSDLFDLFLWHWRKKFPMCEMPELAPEVKSEIAGLLQSYTYKYLSQSLKGLATLGDGDAITEAFDPEATLKIVRRGNFLYFNWRDARREGDE